MGKICAFSGPRPQNLPFKFNENDVRCIALKEDIRHEIVDLIENEGYTHFISGVALGFDTYAAEIVLELKSVYPGLTLEAAIPCENQDAKWPEESRIRYQKLLSQCDKITCCQKEYSSYCMVARNKYLIKTADCLLTLHRASSPGTQSTFRQAILAGKRIKWVDVKSIDSAKQQLNIID